MVLLADPAPAGFSYQWFLNGTALPGFNNQSFSTSSPGDFQLSYTGPCDVDTSAVVQIESVPFPPTPVIGGDSSGTYCDNQDVFIASSPAPNGFHYQWYWNSGPLTYPGDTLPIVNSGTYWVQFDGPCSSPISDSISIQFEAAPPAPVFAQDSVDICAGDQALLDGGMAPAGYGYQWYLDGAPIPAATQQTYTTDMAGEYSLAFTGQCTTDPSEPINLAVQALPAPVINQTGDTLTASEGMVWQWYLDGNPIPGANAQTYVAMSSGNYWVEATDELGCTGSSAELFVVLTALEEWIGGGNVNISPNPAIDQVHISFDLLQTAELMISLTDLKGRLVAQKRLQSSPGSVNTSFATEQLAAGIYLVRIQGEGIRFSERLVVRH